MRVPRVFPGTPPGAAPVDRRSDRNRLTLEQSETMLPLHRVKGCTVLMFLRKGQGFDPVPVYLMNGKANG